MRGIIGDDFDRLLVEQQSALQDLTEEIRNLKQSFFDLRKSFKGDETSFLVEKLGFEIDGVHKVYNKLEGFREVLKTIPRYYRETDREIAYNVSQNDPNIY